MIKNNDIYPGIEFKNIFYVNRFLGTQPQFSQERISVGFLQKPNVSEDFINWNPECYVIVIVLRGEGRYVDDRRNEYQLRPGMLFQRFPGRKHSTYINPEKPWTECYIEVGPVFYQALRAMCLLPPASPVLAFEPKETFLRKLWLFIRRLTHARSDELSGFVAQLLSFYHEICRQIKMELSPDAWGQVIESACQYLGSNFHEKSDLRMFCRKHGLGYENFRKKFTLHVGMSPGQYRINRRLDTAFTLLKDRNLRILDIADVLGFSSQYEFSNHFKRHFGMSPNMLRSMQQASPSASPS